MFSVYLVGFEQDIIEKSTLDFGVFYARNNFNIKHTTSIKFRLLRALELFV